MTHCRALCFHISNLRKHLFGWLSLTIRLNQVLTVLQNKLAAGVDIEIILDKKQQDLFYNDMGERMMMAGLDVTLVERTEAMDSTMHNKFTIIDGKTVLTGSANYSHTAFNISDEDMIVMESTGLAARYTGV